MKAIVDYTNREVEIIDDFTLPELNEFIRNIFGSIGDVKIKVRVMYKKYPPAEKEYIYVPIYQYPGYPITTNPPLYPCEPFKITYGNNTGEYSVSWDPNLSETSKHKEE